jgi:hypothetical protein
MTSKTCKNLGFNHNPEMTLSKIFQAAVLGAPNPLQAQRRAQDDKII